EAALDELARSLVDEPGLASATGSKLESAFRAQSARDAEVDGTAADGTTGRARARVADGGRGPNGRAGKGRERIVATAGHSTSVTDVPTGPRARETASDEAAEASALERPVRLSVGKTPGVLG